MAGDQHKYQIRMFIFFALQWAILALTLMGQPFLFKNPEFVCTLKSNSSIAFPCEATISTCANTSITITASCAWGRDQGFFEDKIWKLFLVRCCYFLYNFLGSDKVSFYYKEPMELFVKRPLYVKVFTWETRRSKNRM